MRLLIAEDDEAFCEVLSQRLEEEGYEVVSARDGQAALEVLEGGGRFDLLLLDEEMPRLTGRQLVKHLRDRGVHTKALLISGHLQMSDDELSAIAVSGLLRKPFSMAELTQAIRKALAG